MVTQIQFETRENHERYLKDFFEEKVSYEDYINFVLGQMYDEGKKVQEVIYNFEKDEFLIIYLLKI